MGGGACPSVNVPQVPPDPREKSLMKWPWQTSEPPPKDLLHRMERLESWMRQLQAEWENVYDQIYRQNQRAARAKKAESQGLPGQETPAVPMGVSPALEAFYRRRMVRKGALRGEPVSEDVLPGRG